MFWSFCKKKKKHDTSRLLISKKNVFLFSVVLNFLSRINKENTVNILKEQGSEEHKEKHNSESVWLMLARGLDGAVIAEKVAI